MRERKTLELWARCVRHKLCEKKWARKLQTFYLRCVYFFFAFSKFTLFLRFLYCSSHPALVMKSFSRTHSKHKKKHCYVHPFSLICTPVCCKINHGAYGLQAVVRCVDKKKRMENWQHVHNTLTTVLFQHVSFFIPSFIKYVAQFSPTCTTCTRKIGYRLIFTAPCAKPYFS